MNHREMQPQFRFEKLKVWQEARLLNRTTYRLTRDFPREELFSVTSQIRRASVSVSANIAEGSGRNSDKDFAHFLEQAYGSLMEVASLFYLATDEGYVSNEPAKSLFEEVERLARGLAALNRSLQVRDSKTPFKQAT
jgi:four helix bundle protein